MSTLPQRGQVTRHIEVGLQSKSSHLTAEKFNMANVKGIISGYQVAAHGIQVDIPYFDSSDHFIDVMQILLEIGVDFVPGVTTQQIFGLIKTRAQSYISGLGDTLADADLYWPSLGYLELINLQQARSYNNVPSRSIVTGSGATGFQVSITRESHVQYSPTMVTTASISGNASDVIVFEICATNSSTAGDWKEIGRLTNAQALTLAITLQSVQTTSGQLGGYIPTGWYAKIRAITSGTVTNSFSSGQEILL